MGNGISQMQSPTKDKEILVDDAPAGQFHRVLVEPDYCLPGPPTVNEDPHEASTLRVGTKSDSTVIDAKKSESITTDNKSAKPIQADKSFFSADVDYAIIPDEEAELIPQNGEKELDTLYVISVSTEDDEQTTNDNTDTTNEIQNLKEQNISEQTKDCEEGNLLPTEDTFEKDHLTKEVIKNRQEKSKKEKHKKESKSVLNMFKFSKHKPKVVAEFVPEVKVGKDQGEKLSANVENHVCLIDTLKESSVDGGENVALIVDNDKNILIQKDPLQQHEKGNNNLSGTDKTNQIGTGVSEIKDSLNVERLNSLDSGIVVNGNHILQNDKLDSINGTQDNDVLDGPDKIDMITEESISDLKTQISEAINDTQGAEVDETITDVKEQLTETVIFKSGKVDKSDKQKATESYEPLDIGEQETRYCLLEDEEKEGQKVETGKSKKKSWSFQFGGNKKNVSRSEKNASTTSVDKISSSVKKKSKSIWSKLSLRKSNDDVSMSTDVDATNEEILYENEKADPKKKNKLKKIKAKKEKKGSLKKTIEEPEDGETFSNDESHLSDEINTPRSRRSIVELEDEAPLVQTDAFEGVSLSDLSLDGDVQVSTSPKGGESHDSPFDRELKKSLAKRAEKLLDNEQTNGTAQAPCNTVHIVQVEIKEPSGKKHENPTKVDTSSKKVAKTSLELESKMTGDIEPSPADEYALIVKDIPSSKVPIQQTEYANLHALPEIEPVLKGNSDSKDKLNSETHQKDGEKTVMEKAVVAVKKENKTIETNKSLGEMLDSLERNVTGKTQLDVKEGIVTPDKSKAVSSEVKTRATAVSNAGETSPGAASNSPDESDAYVHLVQLVQDYKADKFDKNVNNNGEKLVTGTNSVLINLVPMSTESKILPELNSSNLNTEPGSPIHDTHKSAKQKRGVVILKEIGIQAPDIHIPMDIENDFGRSRHGELIDIGVQVSDNDLNDTESFKQDKLISPSVSIESAYF